MEYITDKYIKDNIVESREYQKDLIVNSINQNSLIVLPTGLGKTTVALGIISHFMKHKQGMVLFLAPTKVLANQHYTFLSETLEIFDIKVITGEDHELKRKKWWNSNSIICATPEIARNDLKREFYDINDVSLVIFDEAHRGVGGYAYSSIANRINNNTRIIGMTATLPSRIEQVKEIKKNLKIDKILAKTDTSKDVKPYIKDTKITYIKIDLTAEMKVIQDYLHDALKARYEILKPRLNIKYETLSSLLRCKTYVQFNARDLSGTYYSAISLHYAINMYEVYGTSAFLRFMERSKKKTPYSSLFKDPNIISAIENAVLMQDKNQEHPKLDELLKYIPKDERVLIFTSYRDSVDVIHDKLKELGISVDKLIGKSGKSGLKQNKQVEIVNKFRDRQIQVLISTRVGEEGLDITDVNWVIFFDNVPSSIRYIQRKGRTGRKKLGNLLVFITKNTIDEVYARIGQQKIKQAKDISKKLDSL